MNKDAKLLTEAYQKILKENSFNYSQEKDAVPVERGLDDSDFTSQDDDFETAERMLSDALERNEVYNADPTSDFYKNAVAGLVAAIQHSPEDSQMEADKIARSFLNVNDEDNINEIDSDDTNEILNQNELIPQQQYESNTILNAYKKVISEQNKKKAKNNEYAICTASVGRKNEAKYKRCKKKVAKQINK